MRSLILAVALLALGAPPALAGTATLVQEDKVDPSTGTDTYAASFFDFVGAPGEANDVTVRLSPEGVVVRDTGAPLTAGAGCRITAPGEALCAVAANALDLELTMSLHDGNDRLDVSTADPHPAFTRGEGRVLVMAGLGDDTLTVSGGTGVELRGGAGADRLTGGPGRDTLVGGSGADTAAGAGNDDILGGEQAFATSSERLGDDADTGPRGDDAFDGGDGSDVVVYQNSGAAITADLQAGTGGEPGETDRFTGVENLIGSAQADVLLGDAGPNQIEGGGGLADRIDGRGGNDSVGGAGRVAGGAGDDVVTPFGGSASCGAGRDRLESLGTWNGSRRAAVPVPADCERASIADGVFSVPIRVSAGVAQLRFTPARAKRGTIRLVAGGRSIGTGRVSGTTRRIRIRLTPAGRRALARSGSLTVTLVYAYAASSRPDPRLRLRLRGR